MQMILLMFSGGLDSLGALHMLLTNEKYAGYGIHIHHVHMHNEENRAEAEKIAVDNILAWYRQNGHKIQYTETSLTFPSISGKFPFDNDVTKFISGYIAMSLPAIKQVAFGVTKSDDEVGSPDRIARGNKIYAAFTNAELIYPVRHLSKQEVFDLLPPELVKMSWSCRSPVYKNDIPIPCGVCKTCRAVKLLK